MALIDEEIFKNFIKIAEYNYNYNINIFKIMSRYRDISLSNLTINDIYSEICWIVYNSGFNGDIITKYWPLLSKELYFFNVKEVSSYYEDKENYAIKICNNTGFKNIRKAENCIYNANRLLQIENELANSGGVIEYFNNISVLPPEKRLLIAPAVKDYLKFKGIGNITIFHLFKNIGIDTFKPDIHVCRMLEKIGLLKENYDINDISIAIQNIASHTGLKINEVDTLLYFYGKITNDSLEYIE